MYSTLHVFPWKYCLIRMQWRMNLEISSARNRSHDLNIPCILSSRNCVSEAPCQDETEFMCWGIKLHRISKCLQARWKPRTNIPSAPPWLDDSVSISVLYLQRCLTIKNRLFFSCLNTWYFRFFWTRLQETRYLICFQSNFFDCVFHHHSLCG